MNHESHTRLDTFELASATLEGTMIYDQFDEKVGKISHAHGTGPDAKVVVDVGTFLGFGGKSVMIPVSSLDFMRDEDDNIHATTTWTKEQIEALPEHVHG